jgi:signal transduction histidine kinase
MRALIGEVMESIKTAPGRLVRMSSPFDLPLIRGDAERIKRVIINLLDNALKYSPAGEEVIIGTHERVHDIVICIKDSGPGVKEEERERIFEKFYRGTDKITERTRGSGMGLAIAKGIVEAHHGTIWVESEPGKGSTFCFSLSK